MYVPLREAFFERTNEQIPYGQEANNCQQNEACTRHADAGAPPARSHEQHPGEAESDKKIGRQKQKGDALRKDEEHHRVFFQAS